MKKTTSILILVMMLFSCITTLNTKIEDDISADKLFFKAQILQSRTATRSDNLAVIELYKEVIKRFPELTSICIESNYEIGIIYYKMKDYTNAKNYFYEIIKTHEKNISDNLPEWTLVLSNEMIKKIDEKVKDKIKEVSVAS